MQNENDQNPYKVTTQEQLATANKRSFPRILFLGFYILLALVFTADFIANIEVSRFSAGAAIDGLLFGVVVAVIASICTLLAWAIAGAMIREKECAEVSRAEQVRFLMKSIGTATLFLGIIPTVIQAFSNTYPMSDHLIPYFAILIPGLLYQVVTNFVSYRRQADRKSAFVCTLAGMLVVGGFCLIILLIWAIAQSALT
ncbi:hypothetical protein N9087_00830 [bacterium]|nr:hypothetical protein [Rubripirellula sp.]MDA7873606.1 hypothetical protein [Rhodopirellula sp.]MDA7915521.1 hypothetical protein [bacterium]MDB4506211.1 hypothetical protein [bacterium]MDB4644421.1 hypothetical protein [Rubripirellula sp.]